MLSPYLIVGEILKPQGVRGEIKVRPITNDPDRFWDLERVYLKQGERYEARAMRCTRVHDDFAYVTLEGVNDRNGAEALRGTLLYVRREEAVALSEDENFICDLIGCVAYDKKGERIGKLREVLQPGANDVYIFDTARGEMLLPALRRVVLEVDVQNARMVLDEDVLPELAVYPDTEEA